MSLPGEAVICPWCQRSVGLTTHRRIALHHNQNKQRCAGSFRLPTNTKEN